MNKQIRFQYQCDHTNPNDFNESSFIIVPHDMSFGDWLVRSGISFDIDSSSPKIFIIKDVSGSRTGTHYAINSENETNLDVMLDAKSPCIIISSFESMMETSENEYDTVVKYNKYFMAFSLIHEIGHALLDANPTIPRDTLEECLKEEMLVNELAVLFWQKFDNTFLQAILDDKRNLLPEVIQNCFSETDDEDKIWAFFNRQSHLFGKQIVFLDTHNHLKYQKYFHTYSILKGADSKRRFDELCNELFNTNIKDNGATLEPIDFSDDISTVRTVLDFCKRIALYIPLNIVVTNSPNYNAYSADLNFLGLKIKHQIVWE